MSQLPSTAVLGERYRLLERHRRRRDGHRVAGRGHGAAPGTSARGSSPPVPPRPSSLRRRVARRRAPPPGRGGEAPGRGHAVRQAPLRRPREHHLPADSTAGNRGCDGEHGYPPGLGGLRGSHPLEPTTPPPPPKDHGGKDKGKPKPDHGKGKGKH